MITKWPKISIITPSYNQAEYLKLTIESVLSQKYPNLDYWVIDGGSNDGSVEILKSYGDSLHWISEQDQGQTDAINKGLRKAKGDILAYLNSDDMLTEGALKLVSTSHLKHKWNWATGYYQIVDEKGNELRRQGVVSKYKEFWLNRYSPTALRLVNSFIPQPSTFWSRKAYSEIGDFRQNLDYCMDYDYWLRLSKNFDLYLIKKKLSYFRVHSTSKSSTGYDRQFEEELEVLRDNDGSNLELMLHNLHTKLALTLYKNLK